MPKMAGELAAVREHPPDHARRGDVLGQCGRDPVLDEDDERAADERTDHRGGAADHDRDEELDRQLEGLDLVRAGLGEDEHRA